MSTHFLIHHAKDNVGVVTVEGVEAGQELNGWQMGTNDTLVLKAEEAIPLGHKIALEDFGEGDTVVKYEHDIGRVVAPIRKGGHAHVHNVKTKRW